MRNTTTAYVYRAAVRITTDVDCRSLLVNIVCDANVSINLNSNIEGFCSHLKGWNTAEKIAVIGWYGKQLLH